MWDEQNLHPGDRQRFFGAVAGSLDIATVLYPGSYVDIAASFVFDDVTYVDSDRRAAAFFADTAGVDDLIALHRAGRPVAAWRFVHADYMHDLPVADAGCDLLVSLYVGFVSRACIRYLRPGGWLLVNPSHGDAAMASIDPRYELAAVVIHRSGRYTVSRQDLDRYLIPKRDVEVTVAFLEASGRGVAYTKSPFAYVFRRTGV